MYPQSTHYKTIMSLSLAVLMVLVLCFSLGATSNNSQAIRFEYKVISQRVLSTEMLNQGQQRFPEAHAQAIEITLNKLGKEGWELQESNESFLILQRPLP
ncbi:MAG: DUF4177 domain-containing protein [Phycisphaerae bacterium]|nr:DUF4177 domain-containing protein [Phycisphaerae bacterium]